jgi:hypothetical protein
VFSGLNPRFEAKAIEQVRETIGKRQRFAATDNRALQMFGREEFRPIIDGITIGLQVLLVFIGSPDARHRRRRRHEHHAGLGGRAHPRDRAAPRPGRAPAPHPRQFLAEALVLTLLGGASACC